MAKCKICGSENYRPQEVGLFTSSYFCLKCSKSFDRYTPATKMGALTLLATTAAEFWRGLTGGDNSDGGS